MGWISKIDLLEGGSYWGGIIHNLNFGQTEVVNSIPWGAFQKTSYSGELRSELHEKPPGEMRIGEFCKDIPRSMIKESFNSIDCQ